MIYLAKPVRIPALFFLFFAFGQSALFAQEAEEFRCNTKNNGISDGGWNVTWENDAVAIGSNSKTDDAYTQGMQLAYSFDPDKQPEWLGKPFKSICAWLSNADPQNSDRAAIGTFNLGQLLYTPSDLGAMQTIPDDRPYGAWLYLGMRLDSANLTAKNPIFRRIEIQLGTTGPHAQGEWAQRDFHKLQGNKKPLAGWGNQLPNEFGVQAYFKRQQLFHHLRTPNWTWDFNFSSELAVGTIYDSVAAGGVLRIGKSLGMPVNVTLSTPTVPMQFLPADSNSKDIELESADCLSGRGIFAIKECSIHVGAIGRATAFNAFLDGTMFHGGHSVDKRALTYELVAGARLRWSRFQLDYSFVRRSQEFAPLPQPTASRPQRRQPNHDYGSVSVQCFAPLASDADQNRTEWVCPGFFVGLLGAILAQ